MEPLTNLSFGISQPSPIWGWDDTYYKTSFVSRSVNEDQEHASTIITTELKKYPNGTILYGELVKGDDTYMLNRGQEWEKW
jgi:hypothetical protein